MKIFLSAIETSHTDAILQAVPHIRWILVSFYYLKQPVYQKLINACDEMLIDSGAHSFQKGKHVDWEEYTKRYAEWIQKNDNSKIVGYFEMDVDNVIGYEKVKHLRSILENVSDKIIPVWHKNRGIEDFQQMCQHYAGKIVAVTGFKNEDIQDKQYLQFLKYARKYGCRVHCLGMTRKKVLDAVPFDYCDSSSWKQQAIRGRVGNKQTSRAYSKAHMNELMVKSFERAQLLQEHYYNKWKAECND